MPAAGPMRFTTTARIGGSRCSSRSTSSELRSPRALGTSSPSVNSMHHQAVGTVAPSLATVARAPDGIVEGVEWPTDDWWMVGVQWHPEELAESPEPWDRALLSAFADVVSRTSRLS